jgi:hypothetical protein
MPLSQANLRSTWNSQNVVSEYFEVTRGRPLVTNSTVRDTHMPHRLSWTSTWEHLSFWAPRSVHTGNRPFIFRLV